VAFHAAVDLKGFQLPTVKKPLYPCRAACSISLLLSLAVFKARLDGWKLSLPMAVGWEQDDLLRSLPTQTVL